MICVEALLDDAVFLAGSDGLGDAAWVVELLAEGLAPPGSVFPPPRVSFARPSSTHPTETPAVFFIGMAKHFLPDPHVVITNFPAPLQFPMFPLMQAIWP